MKKKALLKCMRQFSIISRMAEAAGEARRRDRQKWEDSGESGVSRKLADGIYRELLIRFGWGKAKAGIEYYALRLFGGSHWHE